MSHTHNTSKRGDTGSKRRETRGKQGRLPSNRMIRTAPFPFPSFLGGSFGSVANRAFCFCTMVSAMYAWEGESTFHESGIALFNKRRSYGGLTREFNVMSRKYGAKLPYQCVELEEPSAVLTIALTLVQPQSHGGQLVGGKGMRCSGTLKTREGNLPL